MGKLNVNIKDFEWLERKNIEAKKYICGFCNTSVSSEKGYLLRDQTGVRKGGAYICPGCNKITMILDSGSKFPNNSFGNEVKNVPKDLDSLYIEARDCYSDSNFTATVLLCRKILMNIAVDLKAKQNLSFIKYVEYISDQGYVPPNGKTWVDHIRKKGNEANHEIHLMTEQDAKELIIFVEMLLKFNYEFPNMIPDSPSS